MLHIGRYRPGASERGSFLRGWWRARIAEKAAPRGKPAGFLRNQQVFGLANGVLGLVVADFKPANGVYKPADGDFRPADGDFKAADGVFKPADAACKRADGVCKGVIRECKAEHGEFEAGNPGARGAKISLAPVAHGGDKRREANLTRRGHTIL